MSSIYRGFMPPPKPPRYRLFINGETVEGETFGEVILQLRERGFTTEQIADVGSAVVMAPAGEVVTLVVETRS